MLCDHWFTTVFIIGINPFDISEWIENNANFCTEQLEP